MKHESESFQPFKREAPPLDIRSGNLFVRALTAKVIGQVQRRSREDVAEERWPNDRALKLVIRATSAPAMTTVPGWAKELAQTVLADMIEALGAASSAVEVLAESLALQFNGAGAIAVPGFSASANNASFVAEGEPIPVRQLGGTGKLLSPFKVGAISVLTQEMIDSSNAEALIADTLINSAALAIDAVFFSAAAATAAAPAGIRNGIAAATASNNSDPFFAFTEDLATLFGVVGQVGGKGPYFIASNVGRAVSMATRSIGDAGALRPVVANIGNDIIAIVPKAIAAAFDITPDVETANAATLVMDTAPGAAGQAGPSNRSLFQTDTVALKIRWPVSWVVRDPLGVAWLTPTWK